MSAENRLAVVIDHCWSRIGVKGDQSCSKLSEFVHCHNCPVFADAAQLFLDRPLPQGYVAESTSLREAKASRRPQESLSVVVCEVEKQLFALETKAVVEVTEPRNVHRVGHRTGRIFLGIVNIHGQLELCASLRGLLQIASASSGAAPPSQRMVLIEVTGDRWVFPVDAVHGVHRFSDDDVFGVPATTEHDESALVRKVLKWNDRRVGLLDLEKALTILGKCLQ